MKVSYDFSKSVKNPYAKQLKRQITIGSQMLGVIFYDLQPIGWLS